MKVDNEKRRGVSYLKRVADINRIYDRWSKTGLSNREIWRRYIYPKYGVSERTLYYMLKSGDKASAASISRKSNIPVEGFLFPELNSSRDDIRDPCYFKKTE